MTDAAPKEVKATVLPPGTKLVTADIILWKRKDGKIFFHCEFRGQVISHRYGPYDAPAEILAATKAPLPMEKDCGPIADYQLGKLRRALRKSVNSEG